MIKVRKKKEGNLTAKILILIIGIAVLSISVMLQMTFPKEAAWMPDGFNSPVLAFEFLQTNEEVQQFFGPDGPERDQFAEQMNKGHQIDTVFLVCYALFLIAWAGYYFSLDQNIFFVFIILLGLFAAINDAIENQQLLFITNNIHTGKWVSELKYLFISTWIKWGSLALALFGIAIAKRKQGWLGKLYGLISIATLILGIAAFFHRSILTTLFATGISVQFFLLFVFVCLMLFRRRKKKESLA